jgi:hypothetical protein
MTQGEEAANVASNSEVTKLRGQIKQLKEKIIILEKQQKEASTEKTLARQSVQQIVEDTGKLKKELDDQLSEQQSLSDGQKETLEEWFETEHKEIHDKYLERYKLRWLS